MARRRPQLAETKSEPADSHGDPVDQAVAEFFADREQFGRFVSEHLIPMLERVGGLSRQAPQSPEEFDLSVMLRRGVEGLDSNLSEQTAENLSRILARGQYAIGTQRTRRASQRLERSGSADTGKTTISSKSERTRSRRSSTAA